jgi:leucyl aminopeptidase
MKITISLSAPAQLETESLVAIVLDHSEKDHSEKDHSEKGDKNKDAKPQLRVESNDAAVQSAAAELLASGELTGKPFEINLLHKPAGLKAKRILLLSGGKTKKFASYDLRRLAGGGRALA